MVICIMVLITFSMQSMAGRSNGRETEGEQPPEIYKDRAKAMLDGLANNEVMGTLSPLTDKEKDEFRKILRERDQFLYSADPNIKIQNVVMPITLRQSDIHVVKLGHTFTTTLVFTDASGNPWTVDTLTDVSNTEVVSVVKKGKNIIAVRPLKKSGQTNLPVKLAGHQRPVIFLFDISDEEVFFNVDVQLDGVGDSVQSQNSMAINDYKNKNMVQPKLAIEPEKELMLQFITPTGFNEKRLFDEYREPIDPRDFIAWTKGDKLYLLTPHDSHTPDPVDVSASSDGVHKLFEFNKIPVIAVRKGSKIVMLYIE